MALKRLPLLSSSPPLNPIKINLLLLIHFKGFIIIMSVLTDTIHNILPALLFINLQGTHESSAIPMYSLSLVKVTPQLSLI